jgi:serine/threonine protein kinase
MKSGSIIPKTKEIISMKDMRSKKLTDKQQQGGQSAPTPSSFSVSRDFPWLLKSGHIPPTEAANMMPLRFLGKGDMGMVRLTRWDVGKNKLFIATKAINKRTTIEEDDVYHILNERKALSYFHCPFIVSMFGTFQDKENVYLMLEYCVGGSLGRLLEERRRLTYAETQFIAAETMLALEYIQRQGMMYRDMKPDNIMFDEAGHVKLVDFSFVTHPDPSGRCDTVCGSPGYLSPELLNTKFNGGYTYTVDWWSFGCIIFEMLAGHAPFKNRSSDASYEIFLRTLKGNVRFPILIRSAAKDIIKRLLVVDPSLRLTDCDSIRSHEFFHFDNGVSWGDFEARLVQPPFVPDLKSDGDHSYFPHAFNDNKEHIHFKPSFDALHRMDGF